jgi:cobalt-zinc-cadmium efflux system protein
MICKDTLRVLLEGTPHGTNLEKIERKLKKIDNVIDVHELHVWALSAGKPSLSVHLVVDPGAST